MPLYIEDDSTAQLVAKLADLKHVSEQKSVKEVQAELDCTRADVPLRERFARMRALNPLPSPSDLPADKAFFDGLSDDH